MASAFEDDSSNLDMDVHEVSSGPSASNSSGALKSLDIVVSKFLKYMDPAKEQELRQLLKKLDVETLSDLDFLDVRAEFKDFLSPTKLGRFIADLKNDDNHQNKSSSETQSVSLAVFNKDTAMDFAASIFSKAFMTKLKGDNRLSDTDRRAFVRSIGDKLFTTMKSVPESYTQTLSKFLVLLFKSLASVGTNADVDAFNIGNSIYNHVRYRIKNERKRKALLLGGQLPQQDLGVDSNTSQRTALHKFSKRASIGLDPERDVPSQFPTCETRDSQTLKKDELILIHDSGESHNWPRIKKLMSETYVLQRMSINLNPNMENLLKEWPFFAERYSILESHLMKLQKDEFENHLNSFSPKFLKYLEVEANKKRKGVSASIPDGIREILRRYHSCENTAAMEFITVILCVMKKMKIEPSHLFLHFQENTSYDEVQASLRLPKNGKPIVAVLGKDVWSNPNCFVVVEGRCISTNSMNPFKALLSAFMCYFVLKIEYPREAAGVLEFIQRAIFNIQLSVQSGSRVERKKTEKGWSKNPPKVTASYITIMKEYSDYLDLWRNKGRQD